MPHDLNNWASVDVGLLIFILPSTNDIFYEHLYEKSGDVLCMVFLLSHGHIVTQRRLWNIQGSALTSQDWGHVCSPTWWKGNTPQVLCRTFSSHMPHRQSLADEDRSPSHLDVNVGHHFFKIISSVVESPLLNYEKLGSSST